jgi:DNA-binding XRE family transcriptional regulator
VADLTASTASVATIVGLIMGRQLKFPLLYEDMRRLFLEIPPTIGGILLELAKAFGKVLRRQRKAVGLTQEALGLEAQLERNFVSLLELGQRQPGLGTIFKVAGPLQLSPSEIVKMVEDEYAFLGCRD